MHEHTPDHDLMQRMRRGDAAAFDELFRMYGARLCAYAYRLTYSRDVAEELVQDVFLAIWARREDYQIEEATSTYLFRAVRNRAFNYLRHERIERRYAESSAGSVNDNLSDGTHDAGVIDKEIRVAIQTAIAEMPDRAREIFLLNREQGLTYAQIADMMDLSVKAVEYHIGRAFAFLRSRLVDWAPNRAAYEG